MTHPDTDSLTRIAGKLVAGAGDRRGRRGFTIIELLVVLSILGLLIALLWNALTHQLLQSHLQGDYLEAIQFYNLGHGQPVTFWNFLLFGGGEDGDGGVITYLSNGVLSLFNEGVFAMSGAVLGAAVSYRANDAPR